MSRDLIKSSGVDIDLSYPDNIPATIVNKYIIPGVKQVVANLVTTGVLAVGSAIVEASVKEFVQTQAKVKIYQKTYQNYTRYITEDVIPIVTMSKAYQEGRDGLHSMGLDSDILQDGLDAFEVRRKKRLEQYRNS